jgi:hypothetical protein
LRGPSLFAEKLMNDSTPRNRHGIEAGKFDEWPAALRTLFGGASLETHTGFTASLLAADEGGIRTALLSLGELFAPDARTLCFSLWPQSRATRIISKSGRATLSFVHDEAFFQVQLHVRPAALDDASLACFVATIDAGEWQRVSYARLTSGIEFELEGDAVLARWRVQLEMLKAAFKA